MKVSRRNLLLTAGAAAGAASAQTGVAQSSTAPSGSGAPRDRVTTLNGRSLPWRRVDGVKEFHLIANEFEHEFAPGCKAKCWGYNGSTPGPTIEAVEGDRVRILVTNNLPEPTSIHWHGVLLPNGMDGVAGLTQPAIGVGETWAYEFTLRQNGTCMYHPHADEMTQLAFGMMGLFIIHPRVAHQPACQADFAFILHNYALHPGSSRPDPSVMTEFDLWTFNSKVYPAIDTMDVREGDRVRIRIANVSMFNHPLHLHGHRFAVTGSDGGRWPQNTWRPETTEIIGVGQTRDIEFVADNPGDWPLHCHMSHHTMNTMGHNIASPVGVEQGALAERMASLLPDYVPMGGNGMYEHSVHAGMGHMQGPENTLPMAQGVGPFGSIAMGGMMTLVRIRSNFRYGSDPGWYDSKQVPRARRVLTPAGTGDNDAAPAGERDGARASHDPTTHEH
jgi:FtsP/CotA-like multicopper oxidase with cupredoxin domain